MARPSEATARLQVVGATCGWQSEWLQARGTIWTTGIRPVLAIDSCVQVDGWRWSSRWPASTLAWETSEPFEHDDDSDDVTHVQVCRRKHPVMPRPRLFHPARHQPPCASSWCGCESCPATGSFDPMMFLALDWLLWVSWWAPWPRNPKI